MITTLLNSRYQTIQVLGAGGFGETFLAEDTYMPSRRRCVIKQLKPVVNDPDMYQLIQQRFQREAATLESLGEGSEQIPKLYAYFSENERFYLVQEWIQGQTLSSKVETEGPLSESTVRGILVSLLPVLDYVHSQGIIYRDIKPDNIILRQSNGKPVLIDFGAVKETMTAAINSQGKVTHTMVLGTPGFMSPEQGTGRPIYASDIYSVGMTAIYLLTGLLPQELETDQTEQILWQQHALNVSPSLAMVIDQAVQYHPRDRYTTAIKMLDALQSITSTPLTKPTAQATVIVSAAGRKASNQPERAESPVNHPSSQRNSHPALVLGGLLTASLVGVVLFGVVQKLPQTTLEQPIVRSTTSPAEYTAPAVEPTETPSVPVLTEPSPQATAPQQSEQPPVAASPQATAPQQDEKRNESANDAPRSNVPGFTVGTPESEVKAALGNPTKTSRGVWRNTRALLYDLKPNQITLGYLVDRSSGRIRQTEVAFAQSIQPQVIQATVQEMLGNGAFVNVSQGLQRVYERRANNYSFNTGELKGVIERNQRDRIYIGVWDAELH